MWEDTISGRNHSNECLSTFEWCCMFHPYSSFSQCPIHCRRSFFTYGCIANYIWCIGMTVKLVICLCLPPPTLSEQYSNKLTCLTQHTLTVELGIMIWYSHNERKQTHTVFWPSLKAVSWLTFLQGKSEISGGSTMVNSHWISKVNVWTTGSLVDHGPDGYYDSGAGLFELQGEWRFRPFEAGQNAQHGALSSEDPPCVWLCKWWIWIWCAIKVSEDVKEDGWIQAWHWGRPWMNWPLVAKKERKRERHNNESLKETYHTERRRERELDIGHRHL